MGSEQDSNLHQERLRLVLEELQRALLSSREQLERHLRLFPDQVLREALERAEERQERQFPLPFTDAFQAAEQSGEYVVTRPVTVEEVFAFLRQELGKRFFRGEARTSPDLTKRYLIAELAAEEREVFAAIFLDTKHRPLALEKLFYGTIDACSVHAPPAKLQGQVLLEFSLLRARAKTAAAQCLYARLHACLSEALKLSQHASFERAAPSRGEIPQF